MKQLGVIEVFRTNNGGFFVTTDLGGSDLREYNGSEGYGDTLEDAVTDLINYMDVVDIGMNWELSTKEAEARLKEHIG